MNTTTIHPAEVYLRNPNNPSSLYVKSMVNAEGFLLIARKE